MRLRFRNVVLGAAVGVVLLLSGCGASLGVKGGKIKTPSFMGQTKEPVEVDQAEDADKDATLEQSKSDFAINHKEGDNLTITKADGTKLVYVPREGATTTIKSEDVRAATGTSREDKSRALRVRLDSLGWIKYAAGAVALAGIAMIFFNFKREGVLLIICGGALIMIQQLAASPWFLVACGILLLMAVVTFLLEKKGVIKASGYGTDGNLLVDYKRKVKRLNELKAKPVINSEQIKELEREVKSLKVKLELD